MNPLVSIIVPVYNAEKTIGRCIESIMKQDYTNFELLIIDDGSKDNSGAICDEYAADDSRIIVIHKENSGVSDSRNMALDMAQGTYLQFLDADDWITPNATRTFVEAAEDYKADMVISDFYRVVEKRVSQKGSIDAEGLLTREEYASEMMENPSDFYYGVLWNKLYRRDIVEKHNLRMNSEISWCEDFMFNLEYIRHARTFYVVQLPLYYYVKTKGSLVSQSMNISKTVRMKLMVFEYYNNFYKEVLTEEDYEQNRLSVYRYLIDAASDGFVMPSSILPGTKKLGKERMNARPELIEKDGLLMDFYRSRKLLDYYLEPVAIRHELELTDVKVLWGLSQVNTAGSTSELADSIGISRPVYSAILQKLSQKKLIKVTKENELIGKLIKDKKQPEQEQPNKAIKSVTVELTETANSLLNDITMAENNYIQAKYADFSVEEMNQYLVLRDKIKKNTQKIL